MRLTIAGPGRAGGAIALAAVRAGHQIVGVLSRSGDSRYGPPLSWDEPIPGCDLLMVAVRDEAISEVADRLAPLAGSVTIAAHLSGFTPLDALGALGGTGVAIGGFHPLQTLPDPERGADALEGSYVGVGGDRSVVEVLTRFAESLGMAVFPLADESRPRYHAAAAAAANFVITALATAGDLMTAARIDPLVTRPLVERAVANLYEVGGASLTGPIARGDIATVKGHIEAAASIEPDLGGQYRLMAEATAIRAGRKDDIDRWS